MIKQLLSEAEAYCEAAGIKLATLGYYATNDTRLFARLQAGGECLPRTAAKVRAYMRDNPPKSAARAAA
jgi:hypothetical protein